MPEEERKQTGACGSSAVDETRKLWVAGANVSINNWSKIVEEVRALGLSNDEDLGRELLERVKKNDYVPSSKEKEYRAALLEEFKRIP